MHNKLPIHIMPMGHDPVNVPGKRTMPTKSILDPSFKYSSECTAFTRKTRAEDIRDCIALLRDTDRLLRIGHQGTEDICLINIRTVLNSLEKML